MIEVIRLRLLLSFDSLTEFCGKMIPLSEVNANPAIKQRVLSPLRMFKTHCWFLIFLNTKTAVISNKRSRPFFLFFNLIGWLMTSDWQLVNRASLSYFFMKLMLVPLISVNLFLIGYSSRNKKRHTDDWLCLSKLVL